MTAWNGQPPITMLHHPALHVIASALGRTPTVYKWMPGLRVWAEPDTMREVTPREMVDLGMTYFGWVQS